MKKTSEYPTGDALHFVLRVSRLAGVAPISLSPTGFSISRPIAYYSYFLITAINLVVLSGFALDMLAEPERSLRVRTPTSRVIWVTNLSIVMLITCVGIYRGSMRTQCMIECLEKIKQIKSFIKNGNNSSSCEKIKIRLLILNWVCLWVLVFFDVYSYVLEILVHGQEARTLLLYSFFYYEYFLVLLLQFQFILTALELLSALQLVNDALKQLIFFRADKERINEHCLFFIHDEIKNIYTSRKNNFLFHKTPVAPTRCIKAIDILPFREKSDYKHPFAGEIKTVRDLSNAYGAICDVMRYLDDGHGLLLLLIIGSFFLQLIITPYYLLNAIYTSTGQISSISLQICWCIYHLLCMLVVVEPGYQTQKEMDKIQVLVFYLMRFTSPMDPMLVDLDIFYKQLLENRPQYTPFGMCTLSRHLNVTIIGAVTTYLVIIFQFRTYENK